MNKDELSKSELSVFQNELNEQELSGLQQLTLHKQHVIYENALNDNFDIEIYVTRVPGGLIYTYQVEDNETYLTNLVNTFVPFTDFDTTITK